MAKDLIQLQHISKSFGEQLILDDFCLNIHENSFVTLLGPWQNHHVTDHRRFRESRQGEGDF